MMISAETVTQTWQRMAQMQKDDVPALIEQMRTEQFSKPLTKNPSQMKLPFAMSTGAWHLYI